MIKTESSNGIEHHVIEVSYINERIMCWFACVVVLIIVNCINEQIAIAD